MHIPEEGDSTASIRVRIPEAYPVESRIAPVLSGTSLHIRPIGL